MASDVWFLCIVSVWVSFVEVLLWVVIVVIMYTFRCFVGYGVELVVLLAVMLCCALPIYLWMVFVV